MWKYIKNILKEFSDGAFKAMVSEKMRGDIYELEDIFMLLCFSELIGIPNPVSYYTIELIPLVAHRLPSWEKRLRDYRDMTNKKLSRYEFCC